MEGCFGENERCEMKLNSEEYKDHRHLLCSSVQFSVLHIYYIHLALTTIRHKQEQQRKTFDENQIEIHL
jgi:hypothetical protein